MKRLVYIAALLVPFFGIAQKDSVITVHEWGTFTTLCGSDGAPLTGLYIDEEKLPGFVYNLDMRAVTDSNSKGIFTKKCTPKNVTVKMETPVLYFYSDEPADFKIRVDFKGGLISQWYPQRSGGMPAISDCLEGIDFGAGFNDGFVEWEGTLLKPGIPEKYTNGAFDNPIWLSPRATKSNLIKTKDSLAQVEKYLFYRGIGNFEVPFKLEFDKDGLFRITNNNSSDAITYAMVYNKPLKGEPEIWWAGGMAKGVLVKMWPRKVEGLTPDRVINNFTKALVASGLYKDEAEAMMKTWQHSYFETPGLKVFWIVPRPVTDRILPLSMTPLPKSLERVLVGRSEILSPDFEEFIYQVYRYASPEVFEGDRYAEAYRAKYEQVKDKGRWKDTVERYYVYPNVYNKNLYILAKIKENTGKAIIIIKGAAGLIAPEQQVDINDKGYMFISYGTAELSPGTYTVDITAGGKTHTETVVIK